MNDYTLSWTEDASTCTAYFRASEKAAAAFASGLHTAGMTDIALTSNTVVVADVSVAGVPAPLKTAPKTAAVMPDPTLTQGPLPPA